MTTPDASASSTDLHEIVRLATLAPSVHNSQPWLFVLRDGGLDLYVDRSRQLPVLDPEGRQLVISCGAALLHARLAARSIGRQPGVRLLPESAGGDLLTRIDLSAGSPPTTRERRLVEAMPSRHTNRQVFDQRSVPRALAAELARGVRAEGAELRLVERDSERARIAALLRSVQRSLRCRRRRPSLARSARPSWRRNSLRCSATRHTAPSTGWQPERDGHLDVDVEVLAVTGAPAGQLMHRVGPDDLLVVGNRGAEGFARLLLGSVSTALVHHAPCPVLVVRGAAG